jgi:protocatechuate 3,4-dioxygenase beta subunit
MSKELNRRKFLKLGAGVSVGAFAMGSFLPKAIAATCGLTPPQTPGPFYPGEANFTPENDLTRVPGKSGRAWGQKIYLLGKVVDQDCRPIEGVNVEIWQASANGRYNNSRDPNPAPLDPNFRYWGETFTGAKGEYSFKTIIPGAYPASEGWSRPPHIHVRVAKLGYHELVTQMYFYGDPLNEKDLILQALPAAEREKVVVKFSPSKPGLEPGSFTGEFDISIRSVR